MGYIGHTRYKPLEGGEVHFIPEDDILYFTRGFQIEQVPRTRRTMKFGNGASKACVFRNVQVRQGVVVLADATLETDLDPAEKKALDARVRERKQQNSLTI